MRSEINYCDKVQWACVDGVNMMLEKATDNNESNGSVLNEHRHRRSARVSTDDAQVSKMPSAWYSIEQSETWARTRIEVDNVLRCASAERLLRPLHPRLIFLVLQG